MPTTRKKRRLTRFAALGAVLASLGVGALTASPAQAASHPAPATATAVAASRAPEATPAPAQRTQSSATALAPAAVSWHLVGIFPDPVSCYVSGIASGRPYYCQWHVFFWGLYILY
jgi:hypothetical protein